MAHKEDLENGAPPNIYLTNDAVKSLSWKDVGVTVKDRTTKQPLSILANATGQVQPGEMLALMGPSGSGKTTLLNVLSHRLAANTGEVHGKVLVNGTPSSLSIIRQISSFVEQEDHLIGSLTVRETIDFAARLALPGSVTKRDRRLRVDGLVDAFGLRGQAGTIVGTAVRKGISGGQKRRLSVASELVAAPRVLFLDEPTSGLDSVASFEVINYLKHIALEHSLIVIASIHQPSTATFELFDKLMLLSAGKTCYFGRRSTINEYFASISHPLPAYTNPAEFLLDLVNTDFAKDKARAQNRLGRIHRAWAESQDGAELRRRVSLWAEKEQAEEVHQALEKKNFLALSAILFHRALLKSYRDVIAYGIRIAMYTGLAIMMGTVWLRLPTDQYSIQPFINAIFFGGAFMSFMAVAYIPAFMEDLSTFKKERANGLYGPLPFTIANSLIGIPYLFLISIIFSVITYWLSNFQPTARAFWTWVMWLFLDLVAAEGLVVLITNIAPIFVVSLAATAFANGLWMSVNGFMVPLGTLNVFWKYVFHYIDYQAYVFQGMMVNEFAHRIYDCGLFPGSTADAPQYNCMYPSDLAAQGQIRGTAVLEVYRYRTDRVGLWVGIMVAIIVVYRILGYVVLVIKRH